MYYNLIFKVVRIITLIRNFYEIDLDSIDEYNLMLNL